MKKVQIKHIKSGKILGQNIEVADSFKTRLLGLMFASDFGNRDGIWFSPTNSIHSFFCKIKFDALFIDKNFNIVKIYRSFKPWRMTSIIWKANRVLELPEGTINLEIEEGDRIEVIYV